MAKEAKTFTQIINERSIAVYTAQLQDENAVAIGSALINTLELSFFDLATATIINSRDAQNVLNANNVVVTAGGLLTWTLQPADTAILSAILFGVTGFVEFETHRASFDCVFNGSASRSTWDVDFKIRNLGKIVA